MLLDYILTSHRRATFSPEFLELVKCHQMNGSFHSIHNVVDRGVLQAMWEELAGKVGHREQLIIC